MRLCNILNGWKLRGLYRRAFCKIIKFNLEGVSILSKRRRFPHPPSFKGLGKEVGARLRLGADIEISMRRQVVAVFKFRDRFGEYGL